MRHADRMATLQRRSRSPISRLAAAEKGGIFTSPFKNTTLLGLATISEIMPESTS
jgi:hypothetical protein